MRLWRNRSDLVGRVGLSLIGGVAGALIGPWHSWWAVLVWATVVYAVLALGFPSASEKR